MCNSNLRMILVMLFLLPALVVAQAPDFAWRGAPVVIGVDIAQSLPSYMAPNDYPISKTVIFEPAIGFNTRDRKWTTLTAGYIQGQTYEQNDTKNPELNFRGAYARMCFETFKYPLKFIRVGYGPIVSSYSLKGKYQFEGPVFGDYVGHFRQPANFFLGFFGSVIFDTAITKKFRIRLSGQYGTGLRMGGEVNSVYIPGVGFGITRGIFALGINGGLHIFYTIK